MEDRNMPKADCVTAIILIGFGVWIVVHAIHMPRFQEFGANPFSVPGIVPGILGSIITVLSLLVFIRSIRKRGYRLGITGAVVKNTIQKPSFIRMMATCLICVIYGLGMVGYINYYLATFLYVLMFLVLFQLDRLKPIFVQHKMLIGALTQSILVAAAVGAVFRYLFLVDLP
jgi:putative tricarboxylic transport membrane protein